MTTLVQSTLKYDEKGKKFRYLIMVSHNYRLINRLEIRFARNGVGLDKPIQRKKARNGAYYTVWRMRGNIQIHLARRMYRNTVNYAPGNQYRQDRKEFIGQLRQLERKPKTYRTYGIPEESLDAIRANFETRKARRRHIMGKFLRTEYGQRAEMCVGELVNGDYGIISRSGGDYEEWQGVNDCRRNGVDYSGIPIAGGRLA